MQRYYKLEERVFDCLCQFTLAVNCGAREWRLPLRFGCDESERFAAEMTKESPENPQHATAQPGRSTALCSCFERRGCSSGTCGTVGSGWGWEGAHFLQTEKLYGTDNI
jgi:hypothetical protein